MSRSRRKTPCLDQVAPAPSNKPLFNRRFRRTAPLDYPSGNAYRKYNETWDIYDGRFVGPSYRAHRAECIECGIYTTEKDCKRRYLKWYVGK